MRNFVCENNIRDMNDNHNSRRGGRREGAGRPSTDSKLFTFRAPRQVATLIDSQPNKSEFITRCIRQAASATTALGRMGTVVSATELDDLALPYFDIGLVAGFPIPLDNDERSQDISLLRMLCPNPEASYLIRVEGNSMIDADIHSGDIVIVDKSRRNPSESEVAVCELNGEYTLKRFVRRGDEGWLVPANPDFPEIRVTSADSFSVWGTVTYIIHRPRD